jgi:hypothetical protein
MAPNSNAEQMIRILRAGLDRFYSEGFYKWPRSKLTALFHRDSDLENEDVQAALTQWEHQGIVRVQRKEDCYLEVLTPFP